MIDNDTDIEIQSDEPDNMPKSAAISVVDIAGKKFVSGLFWQPLTKPRAYRKEAQEIGKREGMDIVTIRRSTIMQAGFAPKGRGAIKGMYSLAAALAGKFGNSWIGVFELGNDRYAFVAVDDGAIVPDCDVIGDRDDVEQRLRYFYSSANWAKVYVPQDFDYGGEAANIRDLLSDGSFSRKEWREYRLEPLKFGLTPRELATYGIIGLLLTAAVVGGLQYREDLIRKEREAKIRAEKIRLAELERIKENTRKEKTVKALEHPWVKTASVEDFLSVCEGKINTFPLSLGGWMFEFSSCDGGNVTARYKRKETATANGLIADAKAAFDVAAVFPADYESATFTAPVKVLYGGDDVLSPSAEVIASYSSVFQGLGIPVRFVERPYVAPKPPALPGQAKPVEEEAPPPPDWKTFTFSIDTELSPRVLFSGSPWTGMRLTKIEVKLAPETAKLTWTIAGELYAK